MRFLKLFGRIRFFVLALQVVAFMGLLPSGSNAASADDQTALPEPVAPVTQGPVMHPSDDSVSSPQAPPIVIQTPPPPASALQAPPTAALDRADRPSSFLYYCAKANAYYPNVPNCPEGWVAIPVRSPEHSRRGWFFSHSADTPDEAVTARPNAVSLEVGGRALSYSFNFDRSLTDHISLGIGIGTWSMRNWWTGYSATVTAVPLFADYYFNNKPGRGYISAGVEWISVSQDGPNNNTFDNNGVAGVFGGGYEIRSNSGLLLRLGGYLIVGRSTLVNPGVTLGYTF